MKEAFIVSARRTPVGGLLGSLSAFSATQLGAAAIKAALDTAGAAPQHVDSVYMGNVLSAGLGQAPARQAAIFAGIPHDKDATTINKVCSSGLKAVTLAAQQIQLGMDDLVVAGGMESMSNVPHYAYLRNSVRLGDRALTDGMTKDGLWDVYNDYHMGNAAEMGIRHFGFSREELDDYALSSYGKAQAAAANHKADAEIVAMEWKGQVFDRDEDIDKLKPEKVPLLKPAFEEGGLLTAANSSNLNDGAAALVLASANAVHEQGLTPMARILGFADAAQAPEWFTTAPALAIPKALQHAGIPLADIDLFEINEAYASVVLSIRRLLDLDPAKININGGAVALGHPIGASGARILVTLTHALHQENKRYGVAAICNGGGGATAVVIENLRKF